MTNKKSISPSRLSDGDIEKPQNKMKVQEEGKNKERENANGAYQTLSYLVAVELQSMESTQISLF